MQYLRKNRPNAKTYINGVLSGDKTVLGKAITLVESHLQSDQDLAIEVLDNILPHTGQAQRVGITGVPGVGKSTFIESLGKYLLEQGLSVAVLAVDPSSQKSQGSILGDKTRMNWLSRQEQAFIRPSAAGRSLGGVAHRTREAMLLCEAAGYQVILVETMGVGQSEIEVHKMVDFFLLLMLAGAGDELQGIKKGIVEMADAVAITKADGDNLKEAAQARSIYQNALHLLSTRPDHWKVPVLTCSATTNQGMDTIWNTIQQFRQHLEEKGILKKKLAEQRRAWLEDCLRYHIDQMIQRDSSLSSKRDSLENKVSQGQLLPNKAARILIEDLFS